MAKALVLAESVDAQRALAAGARTVADEVALGVVAGAPETGVADKAYDIQLPAGEAAENAYETVKSVFDQVAPEVVFFEPTASLKVIAGKLAAAAGSAIVANITALEGNVATNAYFGGLAEKKQVASGVAFYSNTGALFAEAAASGTDEVEAVAFVEPAQKIVLKGSNPVVLEGADLTKSDVIVGVGRGFAEQDQLKLAEDLAAKVGGDCGCSRPVAENLGWMPRNLYIGVSGVEAAPKAYIAAGISGQMQHMVGVKNAGTIFAINKDANAPIFKQCDYGIVGDVTAIIPEIIAAL